MGDRDPVAVAASLGPIVVTVVRMAPAGVTSHLLTVQRAPAALIPLRVLHSASVMSTLAILVVTWVVVASGAMIAAIAAMMGRDGATSLAPIAQLVQAFSMAVLLRRDAGESDAVLAPHASVNKRSFHMRLPFL